MWTSLFILAIGAAGLYIAIRQFLDEFYRTRNHPPDDDAKSRAQAPG